MKVVDEERIRVMEGPWSPTDVIRQIVEEGSQEDPFYVMDLGEVVARYHRWKELMPRVEPFYAVKCNDEKLLLTTLAALGAGFDCASKAEIELVTSIGVKPDRIIFANPAKLSSHIRYASSVRVRTMTFDSETELLKIKQHMPTAQLLIRIRCDAASAQCPLGLKFGCDAALEAPRLLKLAAVLGLEVIGVSFHVGSGAAETAVYSRAIQLAKALFLFGGSVGLRMQLLDIGGGFPGHSGSSIDEVARVINSALECQFPERGPGVRVVAEPGRYFAAAAYTLATMVHAKREVISKEGDDDSHTMYFVNDGVYGSFNCVLYDHQQVACELLQPSSEPAVPSSVWGPSCDGLDCILPRTPLPPLATGSWLLWRDMGAYTIPVASPFNGFPVPRVRAVVDHRLWSVLRDLWPLTESHFVVGSTMRGPQSPPPAAPASPAPAPAPAPASPAPASPALLESLEPHSHLRTAVFVECALK
ncbi:ornithine decarboxylase 1-like [Plodia interpunctella]|uniref:ornithine decarboxylase 1-like n=1 Tax=Plodia interpunctella TaxID=58824 RepID=UPI002368C112|nr:ornithine decarboxylase 1-like [Plodia interpunctella]XP_053618486.1 ornithine decarboxylase 1-like [Plodia interpunctella]